MTEPVLVKGSTLVSLFKNLQNLKEIKEKIEEQKRDESSGDKK